MLKGNQKKIAPVTLGEEQVNNLLQEWEQPTRRLPGWVTWRTAGMAGAVLGGLLFLVMVSSFIIGHGTSETAAGPSPEETPPGQAVVKLSIVTTPRESIVYIEGDSVGVTPLLGYTISPGDWNVSIRKPGYVGFDTLLALNDDVGFYQPLEMADSLRMGSDRIVLPEPMLPTSLVRNTEATDAGEPAQTDRASERDKEPVAEDNPQRNVGIKVTSQPSGATFWLDGKRIGKTPLTLRTVQGNQNRIRFQKDGYAPYEAEVALGSMGALHRELTALESQDVAEPHTRQPASDESRPTRERANRAERAERPTTEAPVENRRSVARHYTPPAEGFTEHSRTMLKQADYTKEVISRTDNSIVSVEGPRMLEAGNVENFRIVTKPGKIQPTQFYWESEDGVFARGRSIDVQFLEAKMYRITVMAVNDYFVDRATFALLITPPSDAEEPGSAESPARTRAAAPTRTASRPTRRNVQPSEPEAPPKAVPFERTMLYSTQNVAEGQGGYAWVVATHLDRQSAVSDMVRYRMAGYRSGVFEDNKKNAGSVAYRVLIGQFPTEKTAMQVRNRLPGDVPGGIWLLDMAATLN